MKTLIFIPTYNEKENVEKMCFEILRLGLDADILFIDDNSPDGTGRLLDRLALQYPNVNVIHRLKKMGLGSAHLDAINWTYEHKYRRLITMDCDFTHSPEYIFDLIKNSKDCNVVIGSRHILKNSLRGWSFVRKILTKTAHILTRFFLKIEYDATGGFRLYHLDKIPRTAFDLVHSTGYEFLFESLYVLNLNRFLIKEVPIILPARTYGHSKMTFKDVICTIYYLVRIYLTNIVNRKKYKI